AEISSHSGQGIRPATLADIQWVHTRLQEAIETSPFYGERFKAFEKARLSRKFLVSLISTDPWHIAISLHRGQSAGFAITLPEFGTLWSSWIYTLPEFNKTAVGLAAIRQSIAHWENGRFHKASVYVKPENAASLKIFKHFGFTEVALLKQQVLGE